MPGLIPLLLLSACATPASPAQGMYAAFGGYSAALSAAADYAEGPSADPTVVRTLNDANQSAEVRAARLFGRAYTLCGGSNAAAVAGIDCAAFDFAPATVSGYAATLRAAAARMLQGR